jgi:hypothetical protein
MHALGLSSLVHQNRGATNTQGVATQATEQRNVRTITLSYSSTHAISPAVESKKRECMISEDEVRREIGEWDAKAATAETCVTRETQCVNVHSASIPKKPSLSLPKRPACRVR